MITPSVDPIKPLTLVLQNVPMQQMVRYARLRLPLRCSDGRLVNIIASGLPAMGSFYGCMQLLVPPYNYMRPILSLIAGNYPLDAGFTIASLAHEILEP